MMERLPGSMQAAAQAAHEMGITTDATTKSLFKAMEQGKLLAEDFLPVFSAKLMETANSGGALDAAMNSTGAALGRLQTNIFLANKRFNEAGFDRGFRNLLETMSTFINESDELWNMLGSTAGFLAEAIRAPFEILTDLSNALGKATEKGKELDLNYNQMVLTFLALFKWSRKLLAIFVLLPYTLSAMSRAWNEGGIANWAFAIGSAAATALIFRKRLMAIGRTAKTVSGYVNKALGNSKVVTEAAQTSVKGGSMLGGGFTSTAVKSVGKVAGPLGAAFAVKDAFDEIWDSNTAKWLTGRGYGSLDALLNPEMGRPNALTLQEQQQSRQMILNGDIRFEITGNDSTEISDEVIRVINENFIRPTSMNEPNTEK